MSDLIPNISFTEFHKLKESQLRRLKSAEITFNGEYLFTFVNGSIDVSGYLRMQTEYKCLNVNVIAGKNIEQILEAEVATV